MIVLEKELMSKHTTFKIGGPVEKLFIPETKEELFAILIRGKLENKKVFIIGNGSNILVRDKGLDGWVVKNTKAILDLAISRERVHVGSSVMVQKLIMYCINNNLGGLEYLFSVPATVGGAVVMNAGRGKKFNQQISDIIESVEVFDGEETFELKKEECEFGYRNSIFKKNRNWIVIGVNFKFSEQKKEIGLQKIRERMLYVKQCQDSTYPSAGSIYRFGNTSVFKLLKGLKIGQAQFSKKTPNWINNLRGASSQNVLLLIIICNIIHNIIFQRKELEIEIW